MARPSKRSPEREQVILNALRLGNTRTAAAAYAEVHRDTFYEWLGDPTFSDAVEKAEADAEARFVGQIVKAAHDGTWTAAAWWLERRRREHYGKQERVEVTGADGGPVRFIDSLDDHEKLALREAIDARLAELEKEPA